MENRFGERLQVISRANHDDLTPEFRQAPMGTNPKQKTGAAGRTEIGVIRFEQHSAGIGARQPV